MACPALPLYRCRRTLLVLAVLLSASAPPAAEKAPSRIASDEKVLFFPQAAVRSNDGKTWTIPIHGWIFEPERSDLIRSRLLRKFREEAGLVVSQSQLDRFEERSRMFLVDNERGKRVGIRICDRKFTMPDSSEDGHFERTVTLDATLVDQYRRGRWLTFEVALEKDDGRAFRGRVRLRERKGLTVISDIDDTIKVSEVTNKKRLLANTFLRPFQAVDGMPELYRRWEIKGADFTFVSASPWQLYPSLSAWAHGEKFPDSTYDLRQIRLRDSSLLKLLEDPLQSKVARINRIIKRFPERNYILVGDSGEKDPEVFGNICRQHSERVRMALIRDVTDAGQNSRRIDAAFKGVPPQKWQVFSTPDEITLSKNIFE